MAPLQPAYFLLMAEKLRYTVLPNPKVMVMNRTVLRAGAEDVCAPGECTDSSSVSLKLSYHLLGLEVPDLYDKRRRCTV